MPLAYSLKLCVPSVILVRGCVSTRQSDPAQMQSELLVTPVIQVPGMPSRGTAYTLSTLMQGRPYAHCVSSRELPPTLCHGLLSRTLHANSRSIALVYRRMQQVPHLTHRTPRKCSLLPALLPTLYSQERSKWMPPLIPLQLDLLCCIRLASHSLASGQNPVLSL